VEAKIKNILFPGSFHLLYLESHNNKRIGDFMELNFSLNLYHCARQSIPAEGNTQLFEHQRRKDKSIVFFTLLSGNFYVNYRKLSTAEFFNLFQLTANRTRR
jgi:hypothetical protein